MRPPIGLAIGLIGVILAVVAIVISAIIRQHVRDVTIPGIPTAVATATAVAGDDTIALRLAALQEGRTPAQDDPLVSEMRPKVDNIVGNCPSAKPELVSSISELRKVAARYDSPPSYLTILSGVSGLLPSPATAADCFGIFRSYAAFGTSLPPLSFPASVSAADAALVGHIHAVRSIVRGVDTDLIQALSAAASGEWQVAADEWPTAQTLIAVAEQEVGTAPAAPPGLKSLTDALGRGVREYTSGLSALIQVSGPGQDARLQRALASLWGANADVRQAVAASGHVT